MSCQLAVCPLHQELAQRHFPLTKSTLIPVTPGLQTGKCAAGETGMEEMVTGTI